ncbi:Transcription elongation factor GreA [hydrothermal vent metagenome]|uniref:Transcription elongation factor GreA n=1 Tax=hydrothermal vent metagenome TaxID=652676 RepID=A0A3B0UZB3_9ZZZZ
MELPVLTKLREELKEVERELRVDVPRELRTAAAHGDLRENSEYEAAKHRQSFLQARAGQLSQRINSLTSLNLDDIPRNVVGFGSRIYLEDMDSGVEVVYELVTPEEVDPKIGKISVSSPIGRALLNKEEGDDITINLPSGTKEYGVTRLETIHELLLKE